jgi:predicted DNA-binding antitoxin AbrB/MazE fold protein
LLSNGASNVRLLLLLFVACRRGTISSSHPKGGRPMDSLEIEAIYEHGTLKLPRELPLAQGRKVTITIHSTGSAAQRLYGLVQWKGDLEELDQWLNDPDEGQWPP